MRASIKGALTEIRCLLEGTDLQIISAEVRDDQIPQDDYDEEFATTVDVSFEVRGFLLARLLDKQQRVMDRALKELTPDRAVRLISRGEGVAKEILKDLFPEVRKAVVFMAREDFSRGAKVADRDVDWEENTDLWSSKIKPDSIVFDAAVDLVGNWV